ncbi:MAG: 4'-phosphopantetheinyl transferase superfamily protein [Pseudonocardia sp.]|nr:4'-phosphopantetheinyl transferase superfamily protein [Pseudonocardia sp.]
MIERLVPATVACADTFVDVPDSLMWPAEAALVAGAVEKRRREFGTVRHCARQALAKLGVPPVAVLPGEKREPQWPPNIVGSMTHCAGYRGASVAHRIDALTLGIDAEPHGALPNGVLETIALPRELHLLAALAAADPGTCWDRLLFCAKESTYKAWFPLARRWLGFEDASVDLHRDGTFTVSLRVPGPLVAGSELRGFAGQWLVHDGLMLTSICLPAEPPPG